MKKLQQRVVYVAIVAGCFVIALTLGWTTSAKRINNYAYDLMLNWSVRFFAPDYDNKSVVVAVDEATLSARGGMPNIRAIEAQALNEIADAQPAAVALDIILHDATRQEDDAKVEAALKRIKNVVLPCQQIVSGDKKVWEDPLPRFKGELGHVDLREGTDGINRQIPLMELADRQRRYALPLVAFSLANAKPIIEAPPDGLMLGDKIIPLPHDGSAMMYIRDGWRYTKIVSALDVHKFSGAIIDKTVFLGITALSAARDRLVNPFGLEVSGVVVHSQAYETISQGYFLTPARDGVELQICALIAALAGAIFAFRSGWQTYVLGAVLIGASIWMPFQFFRYDVVFPFFTPLATAWLTVTGAAVYQHFFVRRALRKSESEKSRYQQAIHWVAHEMRTPLTAIQGSSEIMVRYNLNEEKQKQFSEMINSESKRLARMIQTFLDVERLSDGQQELKREPFNICDVASSCHKRALPIAEKKRISLVLDTSMDANLLGDRELMEYALYNLITNAIKYSPSETEVRVFATQRGTELRLSVSDQGMGLTGEEQKKIFTKFYRTKSAEKSGEVGTGIGLSIVEQIVSSHGGRMEVASEPGKGSCFTIVLKAEVASNPNAETADRRR